jgi:TPR repeat protein
MRLYKTLLTVLLLGPLLPGTTPSQGDALPTLERRETTSAAAVDAWALYRQAEAYETGKGVSRSWRRARALYERVLDSGDRKAAGFAALALGSHYTKRGSRNPARAVEYFRRGNALGEPWSTFKLAEMHEKGQGVKRSSRRAARLYAEVAAGRDARARMYAHAALGRLHSRAPLRDTKKAREEFEAALRMGDYWSAYPLAELYAKQRRTAENRARIARMLQLLRNSGDPKAVQAAAALSRKLRVR